jgi:ribosomal protein S12 methylthiotransferase
VIRKAHPQVLAVTGPHAADEVLQHVHAHLPQPHDPFTSLVPAHGVKLTPQHFAYLKISEGCNHSCTFCIIPSMRGPLVSRPIGDVLEEARNLAEAGVRELLIISQDTSAYGVDVKYRTGFAGGRPLRTRLRELCEALGDLGIWVRLHYVYPYPSVDALLPLMAEGRILPYLDVPFQHASARVLKAMKRPASAEDNLERLQGMADGVPRAYGPEHFHYRFSWRDRSRVRGIAGFHQGSPPRPGGLFCLFAGGRRGGQRAARCGASGRFARSGGRRLMEVQEDISAELLAAKIGREIDVLVDEVDDEGNDCPFGRRCAGNRWSGVH